MNLSDFVSKFGQAGTEASAACERYAQDRLESLCDRDADGNLVPKTMNIVIGGQLVSVPLISLIAPTRLDVEKFEVQFKANIQFSEDGSSSPTVMNHSGLLRKGVEVEAKIIFNSDASVEAIELLRDKANKGLAAALSSVIGPAGNGPCQHTVAPRPPSEDGQSQAGQCEKCGKLFSRQMSKRTKEYGEWTIIEEE